MVASAMPCLRVARLASPPSKVVGTDISGSPDHDSGLKQLLARAACPPGGSGVDWRA